MIHVAAARNRMQILHLLFTRVNDNELTFKSDAGSDE